MLVFAAMTAGCFSKPPPPEIAGDADDPGPRNYAFVTSRNDIVPNSLPNLAAADAICDSLAAAASKPGTYRAWLSSGSTDAISRLAGASGWVRTDGQPFVNTTADLVAGHIYYPLRLDETGADVAGRPGYVATGSAANGTPFPTTTNCLAGGTGDLAYGQPDATARRWTHDGMAGCNFAARLYCFQIDHQGVVGEPAPTGRRAFLSTSPTAGASAQGLPALDAACANEGGSTNFIALVATTTASALDRLAPGEPWVRPDGVVFLTGELAVMAPLNVERDKTYGADDFAWFGAAAIGLRAAANNLENCTNWTVQTQTAQLGRVSRSSTTEGFGGEGPTSCGAMRRLYCVEQ